MQTESRAVMLTDMKGFTAATIRQTRDQNAHMLALHDALLFPLVRAFGGLRVKTIGDAYLVVFEAPTQALFCGMAIQDRLWDYNQRVAEDLRMDLRVAVSFGEVRIVKDRGGGDVFGEAVNLAARVEGEAPPGDIWFTEAVYWVADRSSVPMEEMGRRQLKGLPEAVRLFRVARDAAACGTESSRPPYRNAGLALVRWLPPPEPRYLARLADVARPASRWRARLLVRAVGVALFAATFIAVAAAAGLWLRLSRPERLIHLGRHEEARAALEVLVAKKGSESPQVLFLRGLVEAASADAGPGGSVPTAFQLWSRGVALGSDDALAALAREARAGDCGRRSLATRALADARTRRAADALESIAAEEPPPAGREDALHGTAAAPPAERCGTGDIARQGLRAIERR